MELENGNFALKSFFGKYFCKDVGSEKALFTASRGDSTEIGENETILYFLQKIDLWQTIYRIKYQALFRHNENLKLKKVGSESSTQVEKDALSKFHSFGFDKTIVRTENEKKVIKKAKERGKLFETLLDKRAKTKSDKFCK